MFINYILINQTSVIATPCHYDTLSLRANAKQSIHNYIDCFVPRNDDYRPPCHCNSLSLRVYLPIGRRSEAICLRTYI